MATYVIAGCAVAPASPPTLHVVVASGTAILDDAPVTVTGATLAIAAADTDLGRFDAVVAHADGTVHVVEGGVLAPDSAVVPLALVFVGQNVTAIEASDVNDRRPSAPVVPFPYSGSPTPSNGDLATFDAASGKWVNAAPSGGGYQRMATVTLTDAQIKALPTAYQVIVPAPGAGLVLVLDRATLLMDHQAGAYTNLIADPGALLVYADWAAEASNKATFPAGTGLELALLSPGAYNVSAAGDWTNYLRSTVDFQTLATILNQPLKLVVGNSPNGDLTGGNAANSLAVSVRYAVLDTATGAFVPA